MNYPKERYTGEKPWMNRDWLYEEYVVKDRSTADIAKEYGCVQNTIQCWLLKHGIKKKITTHNITRNNPYQQYDFLYKQHIVLGKSMSEIARECNVSSDTIRENLKRCGIEPQSHQHRTKYTEADEDLMIRLYCDDRMSAYRIAMMFNTDHNTIIRHLNHRGIETRDMQRAQFVANNKDIPDEFEDAELLRRLHWDDGMSCKEIGQMLGVDAGAVRRQMKRLGVPTKNNAQSKIGQMVGDKHPNWRGGITPLSLLLREYFHTNIAPVIAKRDEYTCQLCGKTHTVLHVHHITSFTDIVSEICAEHPDLSPNDIDDRIELYRIITADQRFLDEGNLITFCRDCHFNLIHEYKTHKTISSQASKEEGSETIPDGSTPEAIDGGSARDLLCRP